MRPEVRRLYGLSPVKPAPIIGTAALAPPLTEPTDPPAHLRPETAAWYQHVCETWEITPSKRRLLQACCAAWDLSETARETIAREGMTVRTADGGTKVHPLMVTMKTARQQFASLLGMLDLAGETGPS
ncbi:MAG TPA: P27 family phage terminase small subunit [Vicinamibacterales bacterium]|jgi:P27 family predicted phage terminase small subunit